MFVLIITLLFVYPDSKLIFTFIQNTLKSTPWLSMLSSGPMWGLMIGQIAHDWALFMINADLPKYMKSVMKFSIAEVRKSN